MPPSFFYPGLARNSPNLHPADHARLLERAPQPESQAVKGGLGRRKSRQRRTNYTSALAPAAAQGLDLRHVRPRVHVSIGDHGDIYRLCRVSIKRFARQARHTILHKRNLEYTDAPEWASAEKGCCEMLKQHKYGNRTSTPVAYSNIANTCTPPYQCTCAGIKTHIHHRTQLFPACLGRWLVLHPPGKGTRQGEQTERQESNRGARKAQVDKRNEAVGRIAFSLGRDT